MIVVILKNTLLILLIILIVHFMIKNSIVDNLDMFKRKVVHDESISHVTNSLAKSVSSDVDNEVLEERNETKASPIASPKKKVHFNMTSEYEPECPNGVRCEDYKTSDESGMRNEQSNMKELYDFVFDDKSSKDTEKSLDSYFPKDVKDKIQTDRTELSTHLTERSKEQTHCDFEVIGVIEMTNDPNSDGLDTVNGIDTLSSNYFSSI